MKVAFQFGWKYAAVFILLTVLGGAAAQAQNPVVVGEAAAIIVETVKPKKQSPYPKFEGTVMNSNNVLITVRSKENELAVRTFNFTEEAAAQMQKIIDKGGYQYGDKVTIFYDPATNKAVKVKGKASKPI